MNIFPPFPWKLPTFLPFIMVLTRSQATSADMNVTPDSAQHSKKGKRKSSQIRELPALVEGWESRRSRWCITPYFAWSATVECLWYQTSIHVGDDWRTRCHWATLEMWSEESDPMILSPTRTTLLCDSLTDTVAADDLLNDGPNWTPQNGGCAMKGKHNNYRLWASAVQVLQSGKKLCRWRRQWTTSAKYLSCSHYNLKCSR